MVIWKSNVTKKMHDVLNKGIQIIPWPNSRTFVSNMYLTSSVLRLAFRQKCVSVTFHLDMRVLGFIEGTFRTYGKNALRCLLGCLRRNYYNLSIPYVFQFHSISKGRSKPSSGRYGGNAIHALLYWYLISLHSKSQPFVSWKLPLFTCANSADNA